MKNKLVLVMCLVTSIVLSGCSSSSYDERVLSDEQWIEDIETLDNNLREYHSDVFRFISEDEYEKNIESLKLDVNELSDSDIKFRIVQIVASVDDDTNMLPNELVTMIPSRIPKGDKNN